MLDFRILGPLEVRDGQAAIALGGPRQRALLVALLLRAGRVVPTEQLVDELYGEEPPKTATRRSRTPSSRCGRRSGRTSSSRDPRATSSRSARAGRRPPLRAAARGRARASPGERRALLVRALELWRGPALAEFAFEDWAQTESRRLEELRARRARGADRDGHRARPPGRRRRRARGARRRASAARAPLVPADAGAPRAGRIGGGAPGLHRRARRARRARASSRARTSAASRARSSAARRRAAPLERPRRRRTPTPRS